ncbi:MAG: sorbosone dehydrogenase family protein [Akkermansiaceae bacterium]
MKTMIVHLMVLLALSIGATGELASKLVAKGFERPVWAGAPSSVKGKLWVMEQAGTVFIVDLKTGEREKEPFLEITDQVTRKGNEQGLLGLAFDPNFEKNGRYYVNFNKKKGGDSVVVRFVSEDRRTTDPGSGETILEYDQPYGNHNGGWLDFGPDGYLYVATGDGGSANDPKNLAQDMSSLLGKVLRLDVSGAEGYEVPSDNPYLKKKGVMPEIIASGLRNPWRCSFDRKTGDFWIGDVGQNAWEEIDMVKKGELFEKNFGWRLREGEIKTPKKKVGGAKPDDNEEPVYVYAHGTGPTEGLSVTGGFVYRGSEIPDLQGRYVFADYANPRIWSFELKDGKASGFSDHTSELQPEGGRINQVSSFAEDADGELYLLDHTGAVYRIADK